MARRLTGYVHVRDAQGWPVVFGPTDDVPEWAADKISNPAAWTDGAALPTAPSAPAPAAAPERQVVADPPPQAGRGSSVAAWRSYAEEQNVTLTAADGRDDIINKCRTSGVPV